MAGSIPRWLAVTAIPVLGFATGCGTKPSLRESGLPKVPKSNAHGLAAVSASSTAHESPPASTLDGEGAPTTFHRVAEFPYQAHFAPLGTSALLLAGEWRSQILLLIENNQLTFRPELARLDSATAFGSLAYAVSAGTWPDNAWLALSDSSPAGPCDADIYHWDPEPSHAGWVKRFENSACVSDLLIWNGNPVLVGAFFDVPVLTQRPIETLLGSKLHTLDQSSCALSGSSDPPTASWVHDGALTIFSYACRSPETAGPLLIDTWNRTGSKTERSLPLGSGAIERVLVDDQGLLFLFPKQEHEPAHLSRFADGAWTTLVTLPADFVTVSVPNSLTLWGVSDGQLRHWDNGKWLSWPLPKAQPGTELSVTNVWPRSAQDIWLVAEQKNGHEESKVLLFNSADGSLGSELPSTAEQERLSQAMTHEPEECPHPFANFVVRLPHQLGADVALPYLSDNEVRRRLRKVLRGHPEFAQLRFVEHDCYGEACVGAQVTDAAQAAAFRALLPEDGYSGRNRCSVPPVSKPFAL